MSQTSSVDVSVIIVNYKTKAYVDTCIASIKALTDGISYEVIIVDNASYDGIAELVKEKFPDVIFIQNGTNAGFGAANNLAVKQARGKYLFFLNPDTYLKNNGLKAFFDFMEEHKEDTIGVAGAVLSDQNDRPIHSHAHFKKPFKNLFKKCRKSLKRAFFLEKRSTKIHPSQQKKVFTDPYKPVDYVTGADMFMEKRLFEAIGGFDESFFMYYEETDLQRRLAKEGYQRVLINTPRIVHHVSASFAETPSVTKRIMMNVSEVNYMRIQYGWITGIIYKTVLLLCAVIDLFVDMYRKRHTIEENFDFIRCIWTNRYFRKET